MPTSSFRAITLKASGFDTPSVAGQLKIELIVNPSVIVTLVLGLVRAQEVAK
jgi:hypothetical protein